MKRTRHIPRLETLEDRFMPAVRTWDGEAVLSNNWSNANNWVSNIAPVAGDDLVFPANVSDKTVDNDFAAGTLFNSITLGGGYTLKGNRIRIGVAGIIDNSSTSDVLKLDVSVGVAGESNRTFSVGTGSTLFIDGEISGAPSIIKTGLGNLSFRSNNSYIGQTQVNAGTLSVEKDSSLGTLDSGTVVRSGATLLLKDTVLGVLRIDEAITFENNATLRALNDVELGGSITLLGNAILKHEPSFFNDKLSIGFISGSGGVSITAGGHVWYHGTGSNSYLGVTSVSGELHLDMDASAINGALSVNNGGLVQYEEDRDDQISDLATVTINGTGKVLMKGQHDTINKLVMNGGHVNGKDPFNLYFGELTVRSELIATSISTSLSATIDQIRLVLASPSHSIRVNDGPAFDDLFADCEFVVGYSKEGAGVMLHDNLSTSTVDYVINEGLLRFHSEAEDSTFIVNAGGKLSGNGSIGSLIVNAGGRVHPGPLSSTGTLTIKNNLQMNPGAILEVALNGSSHDQLDVDGNVTVAGALLEPTLGSSVFAGLQFRIINGNSDPVIGGFQIPASSTPFILASPTGQRLSINNAAGPQHNDVIVTLENTPPMAPGLALNRTTLDEGGTVTASGHLVDPDPRDKLRLFVNWGDGSRQEVFRPGLTAFSLRHRYSDNGQYTARFEWLEQHGQGNSRSFDITVENVAPQITLKTRRIGNTDVYFASGFYQDPGRDQIIATVDYGDGTGVHPVRFRHGRFLVAHRYRHAGTYDMQVHIQDDDDGVTNIVRVVSV